MKKDFANYLAVEKLMVVEWAQSQGCSFDFSTINLDSSDGYIGAIEKVTTDLKSLGELPTEAENFNSFPKDFPVPSIPAKLENHVKACLSAHELLDVPSLSKRAMKEFSTINFDIELILPRGWFAVSSHSGSVSAEMV